MDGDRIRSAAHQVTGPAGGWIRAASHWVQTFTLGSTNDQGGEIHGSCHQQVNRTIATHQIIRLNGTDPDKKIVAQKRFTIGSQKPKPLRLFSCLRG
jgi:hypothetical protein